MQGIGKPGVGRRRLPCCWRTSTCYPLTVGRWIWRAVWEADRRGLPIRAETRDLQAEPPEAASFDVILVAHFLIREAAPVISGALRPGGLLFFQTFVREAVSNCGPSNPEYRLGANELLRLFPKLIVRFYREEGRLGNLSLGTRDVAMLVAQRVEGEGLVFG